MKTEVQLACEIIVSRHLPGTKTTCSNLDVFGNILKSIMDMHPAAREELEDDSHVRAGKLAEHDEEALL